MILSEAIIIDIKTSVLSMGSSLSQTKGKPVCRNLETHIVSLAIKEKTTRSEEEEIIYHIKEQEIRKNNRLSAVTLKNFAKVLAKCSNEKKNKPSYISAGEEKNLSAMTSDKSNFYNGEFIQSPNPY